MQKLIFGLVIVSWLLVLAPLALAAPAPVFATTGNPGDTITGTVINAKGTSFLLHSQIYSSQLTTRDAGSNLTNTVTSEFGYSGPTHPADLNVSPGDIVYNTVTVTHEGNANDSAFIAKSWYQQYGGAAGWIVERWANDVFKCTLEANVATQEALTSFDEDTHMYTQYKVFVSSEVSGAPNGSYITILSTFETTSTPVGSSPWTWPYTGGNYLTYGGWASSTESVADQVSAPVLTLTRTSTVDAPIVYSGGRHDAVPGSVITFTMTYGNIGGASAESVILVDRIPDNTKLAHVNNTGPTTNVTIEAAQGDATGWSVYYSTVSSPDKSYGVYTNWTLIGTIESTANQFPSDTTTYTSGGGGAYNATWIKWEKLYVDQAEDDKILTWGATIR